MRFCVPPALLVLLLVQGSLAQAQLRLQPAPLRPGPHFSGFESFAKRAGMKHAFHDKRLYIAAPKATLREHWADFVEVGNGKVLEFTGRSHLHTRFDRKRDVDFYELLNISTFEPPKDPRVTVVAQLLKPEYKNFKTYFDAANGFDAPKVIGTWDYNGGIGPAYFRQDGRGSSNCTTWLNRAKLGENGETLSELLGVPHPSAAPSMWIKSLAQQGNERVVVMLHQFEGDVANRADVDRFIQATMTKPARRPH